MAYNTKTTRKARSHRHSTGRIVAIVCGLLVVAGGVFAFLYFKPFENKNTNNDQKNEKTDNVGKSNDSTEPLGEKTKENEREKEKPSVAQYEGEDPNKKDTITGVVSHAGIADGSFMVQVMLDQALGNTGTCNFVLTHSSGATLTSTSATEAGPSSSFCIYSVPASSVNSGYWSIKVTVSTSDKEGVITGEASI